MNGSKTEIIFLLDRSGSMAGLETETISGFNALIKKQNEHEGVTKLTTVLFDDKYEVLWDGVDAKEVKLTEKEYYVRGYTALLDAIGKTILNVEQRISKSMEADKPGKVLIVITTDGLENASHEFTHRKVKELIKRKTEQSNWEFIFIGANMDAVGEAEHIGISKESAFNFEASSTGVMEMYCLADEAISKRRNR